MLKLTDLNNHLLELEGKELYQQVQSLSQFQESKTSIWETEGDIIDSISMEVASTTTMILQDKKH
jgi:hypothetical protein